MTAFEEFGVLPEIAKAIEELEWMLPTDIQSESIPLILGGGDVLMAAETGSGKTAAFCLPIIQLVWETLKDLESGKIEKLSQNISPAWVMSTLDRSTALAVSPDGLRTQSREQNSWHGVRCTRGIRIGKWGFEATVGDEGICRVGWSSLQANLELGTCRFGFGFGGTGKKSNNKKYSDYGDPFGKKDVITCLLDLDKGEVKYLKNGIDLGTAFIMNMQEPNDAFFPAVVLKNSEMSFNFGSKPFKYALPEGYLPVNVATGDQLVRNTNCDTATSIKISTNAPQAIIIEPSRELAEQTYTQIKNFKKYLETPLIREMLLTGGINIKDQIADLQKGVHIIVGTPGRLEDLIQGGYLDLESCRFFVLDEADGLLKDGYTDLIERLHGKMPKITSDGRRLQMIVCSATLHAFDVKKMAEKLMHFPTWVDLKGEDAVPETIHHVVVNVDPQTDRSWINLTRHVVTDGVHAKDEIIPEASSPEVLSEAVKLLKGEYVVRAIDEHQMDKAIIFCRTKLDCDNLEKYFKQLDHNKYTCVCLHGDRKPFERKANLQTFKQGNVKFLICTDVAARGLDISGLPFMINVTLPDIKTNYVHRIGRVGRAERMGLAISLVSTVPEKVWYHGHWCKRGKSCRNTNLTDQRGCCVWYNEPGLLGEIEEHLNITIQQIESNIKVPHDEFDGKVIYGQMKQQGSSSYENHTDQMAPAVKELSKLESEAQLIYLNRHLTAELLSLQVKTEMDIDPPPPPEWSFMDPTPRLLFQDDTRMDIAGLSSQEVLLTQVKTEMDTEPPPPPQWKLTAPTPGLLLQDDADIDIAGLYEWDESEDNTMEETINEVEPPAAVESVSKRRSRGSEYWMKKKRELFLSEKDVEPPPPRQIRLTAPTSTKLDPVVTVVVHKKKKKPHRHRHLRRGGLGRRGYVNWMCTTVDCEQTNFYWREKCIRCHQDSPQGRPRGGSNIKAKRGPRGSSNKKPKRGRRNTSGGSSGDRGGSSNARGSKSGARGGSSTAHRAGGAAMWWQLR